MDTLLKIALYLTAGSALLVVNIWFARLSLHSFSARELPDTVAPIQLVGKEDKDIRVGQALAGMLLARLGKIRQEMTVSAAQLREQGSEPQANALKPQEFTDPASLALPERLFEPLDINMKVGGVEVSGILNWTHRALVKDNVLQLAVENENGRALISGSWNDGRDTIWIELKDESSRPLPSDRIASAIAYALTQKQFANRIPAVGAFTVEEFQELLTTLNDTATLQRRVSLGRVAASGFVDLYARIEKLVERTPNWPELVQLAANLADNAGETEKAIGLYTRALDLKVGSEQIRADLETRLAKLTDQVVAARTQPPDPGSMPGSPIGKRLNWPLDVLGIESVDMTGAAPRIAVVGGPPATGTLQPEHYQLLGEQSRPPDAMMGEYIRTVVQAVTLVAPNASFVFAQSQGAAGAFSKLQLLAELDTLVGAKPDILLITVGPLEGPEFKQLLDSAAAQNILVITAAGNNRGKPISFSGDPVLEKFMTVAAIGADGNPSSFSQTGKSVFWAPGEKIPVRPRDEEVSPRDGTTYSAALAAGVAARMLAARPKTSPSKIISVLRETARSPGEGKPDVMNLSAALQKLGST